MCGCYERVGRRYHFSRYSQRLECGDERDRPVREQRDVLDAQELAQRRLELLMEGAVVGELLGLPDRFEIWNEFVEWRQKRLGHVDRRIRYCFVSPVFF